MSCKNFERNIGDIKKESDSEGSDSFTCHIKPKNRRKILDDEDDMDEDDVDKEETDSSNINMSDEEFQHEMKKENSVINEYDINGLLAEHAKKNKIPKEDVNKLWDLKIKLIHEVPHQHTIEKHAGSHVPDTDVRRRFQKYIELKKGTYSPEEDHIIVKNWKKFCKCHNWDKNNYKPFLYFKHGNKLIMRDLEERKKFVQFLANGLPNRTLYSVYHRFRNLHAEHSQNRYTLDDDEMILMHIEENPNVDPKHMFSDLAKILNRTRASVWRRYQLLKRKKQKINYN